MEELRTAVNEAVGLVYAAAIVLAAVFSWRPFPRKQVLAAMTPAAWIALAVIGLGLAVLAALLVLL